MRSKEKPEYDEFYFRCVKPKMLSQAERSEMCLWCNWYVTPWQWMKFQKVKVMRKKILESNFGETDPLLILAEVLKWNSKLEDCIYWK